MKRFLPLLLLAISINMAACFPTSWRSEADYVNSRLVRLEHPVEAMEMFFGTDFVAPGVFRQPDGTPKAVCTGFVIDAIREYVLTANHCADPKLTADGKQTFIVFQSEDYDLMILRVEKLHKKALFPARRNARNGEFIASVGYGYGLSSTIFKVGVVANANLSVPDLGGTYLIVDNPFIGGMSGGPIVNSNRKVVGIVQRSDVYTGIGQPIETILQVTGEYWGSDPQSTVW